MGVYDPVKKVFRKNNGKHLINGVSDILGILKNGKLLAIEVKSKTGRLTGDQRVFLERIKDNGGLAFVARSISDVINKFKELKII